MINWPSLNKITKKKKNEAHRLLDTQLTDFDCYIWVEL